MTYTPLTTARAAAALAALALSLAFAPRGAVAQTLINGDFSSNGGAGQLTVNTTLTGWTGGGGEGGISGDPTKSPVFVFDPGTTTQLTTTGVTGDTYMGTIKFYGATAAPGGGVIIAADGDPSYAGSISQTVTGLTIGQIYNLTFKWAGAQQQGYSGATTEKWQVSFGSSTQSTAIVNTPSQSFVGWQSASMAFTASSTSQALTFLAVGTPGGQPPWLLLNGVSLTPQTAAVPEPSSLALGGLLGLGVLARGVQVYRRKAARRAA